MTIRCAFVENYCCLLLDKILQDTTDFKFNESQCRKKSVHVFEFEKQNKQTIKIHSIIKKQGDYEHCCGKQLIID